MFFFFNPKTIKSVPILKTFQNNKNNKSLGHWSVFENISYFKKYHYTPMTPAVSPKNSLRRCDL